MLHVIDLKFVTVAEECKPVQILNVFCVRLCDIYDRTFGQSLFSLVIFVITSEICGYSHKKQSVCVRYLLSLFPALLAEILVCIQSLQCLTLK